MGKKKGWDHAFTAKSPYGTVKGSPSYAGALSFMRRMYSKDLAGVDVAVTGIPLDTATTNRPGARFGPRAVRAASTGISWERPWPWDFNPFDALAVIDYGDCEFDKGAPETIVPFIEEYCDGILDAGAASLVIGGDHFVTYPVLRAYAKEPKATRRPWLGKSSEAQARKEVRFRRRRRSADWMPLRVSGTRRVVRSFHAVERSRRPPKAGAGKRDSLKFGPLSLVQFDAHSDTWGEEQKRLDHGTMFFHAVREGLVDNTRSVQIGLRTTNDEPMEFNILDARWVHRHGPESAAAEARRIVGDNAVYLTLDIDCLDPSFAPGTGTPVRGGLSTHQALETIRGLAGINLVGMDVVEVAPVYDVGEITALAGATLAAECLCLYAANPGRNTRTP